MPRWAAWLGAATAVGALASAASCFVAGFDVGPGTGTGGASQGAGGAGGSGATSVGGGGTAGGVCIPVKPPAPPAQSDPGADVDEIVLAVHMVEFAEELADVQGATIGYDLDDVCTCRGDGPSCVEPDYATGNHCDGPQGLDNAFSTLVAVAGAFNPSVSSTNLSAHLHAGLFGLLIRVRGYNGQPNDDDVEVALFPSGGLDEDACVPAAAPSWDGTDAWPVDAEALLGIGGSGGDGGAAGGGGSGAGAGSGGCSANQIPDADLDAARFTDPHAYVTGSVLVASFPEALLLLSGEPETGRFHLGGTVLTGQLSESAPGVWALTSGLLAGRARLQDVWDAFAALANGGTPLCTDEALFGMLRRGVCGQPDIAAELSGPTVLCDAASLGMQFVADAARLGVAYRPRKSPATCPEETRPGPLDCTE